MVNIILFGESYGVWDIKNNLEHRSFSKNAGLLRLSHYLRRQGFSVLQVHHISAFSIEELDKLLEKYISDKTVLIGLSTSFISAVKIGGDPFDDTLGKNISQKLSADTLSKIEFVFKKTKSKNEKIKTVIGGHEIFSSRFKKLEDLKIWGFDGEFKTNIDYFIEGEAELLLTALANGLNPNITHINGYNFLNAKTYLDNDYSERASSPAPIVDCINQNESLISQIGHGCIFNCQFCSRGITSKNKNDFIRSKENFFTEMEFNYKNFGTKFYLFTDDMMNDNDIKLKWLTEIRNDVDIRWSGYSRLDVVNEEWARLFKSSGAAGIYFGLETFKKSIGPMIGKMTEGEKVKDLLRIVRNEIQDDTIIKASFIAGLPTETYDEFSETINWVLYSDEGQHLIDRISINPLHVFKSRKSIGLSETNRVEPFKDYIIEEDISKNYSAKQNWSSPWGTREGWGELTKSLYKNKNRNFFSIHPFYFTTYVNCGVDIQKLINDYRQKKEITTSIKPYMSKYLISQYKKNILDLTEDNINEGHKEFWETFPIVKKCLPIVIPILINDNEEPEVTM